MRALLMVFGLGLGLALGGVSPALAQNAPAANCLVSAQNVDVADASLLAQLACGGVSASSGQPTGAINVQTGSITAFRVHVEGLGDGQVSMSVSREESGVSQQFTEQTFDNLDGAIAGAPGLGKSAAAAGVTIKSAPGEAKQPAAVPHVEHVAQGGNREIWGGVNASVAPLTGTQFVGAGLGITVVGSLDALLVGGLLDFATDVTGGDEEFFTLFLGVQVGYEFVNLDWVSFYALGGLGYGIITSSLGSGPIDPTAISGEGQGVEGLTVVGARWLRSRSVNILTEVRARFPFYALERTEFSQAFGSRDREFWAAPVHISVGILF